ncbi:MAG: hypothetical protein Q9157_005090 [Trypethelium eluteriae]
MPKATRGNGAETNVEDMLTPVDATGVLVQCDPSIKAIINKIDAARNDFIVEDLDDETVLIKETKMAELKERLKEVSATASVSFRETSALMIAKELRDTVKEAEESESD